MKIRSILRGKLFRHWFFLIILLCEVLFFFINKASFTRSDYFLHFFGFMIFSTLSLDSVGLFLSFHFLLIYTLFYTSGDLFFFQTLWLYFLAVICIFFTGRSKINFISSLFAHFFSYFIFFNISLYSVYSRCHDENVVPQAIGFKAFVLFLFSTPLATSMALLTENTFTKINDREKVEDFLWDGISLPFRLIFTGTMKVRPSSDILMIALCFYLICFGFFYYFYNPSHLIMPSYCGD